MGLICTIYNFIYLLKWFLVRFDKLDGNICWTTPIFINANESIFCDCIVHDRDSLGKNMIIIFKNKKKKTFWNKVLKNEFYSVIGNVKNEIVRWIEIMKK